MSKPGDIVSPAQGNDHTLPDLTPEAASRICMDQCNAMCCRGPLILRLTEDESADFRRRAEILGIQATVSQAPVGGWVKFSDHPGERCPMLDEDTWACRIYQHRPQRCRSFPEKPTPGCAISGWLEGE